MQERAGGGRGGAREPRAAKWHALGAWASGAGGKRGLAGGAPGARTAARNVCKGALAPGERTLVRRAHSCDARAA